jgi:hypothetical protein
MSTRFGQEVDQTTLFSWRREIGTLPPKERLKWFYEQKILPVLSESVSEAEAARIEQNHQKISEVTAQWLELNQDQHIKILAKARERAKKNNFRAVESDWLVNLSLGLMGLARIKQVDLNSQLTDEQITHKEVSGEFAEYCLHIYSLVEQLYDEVDVTTLPSKTIHNGPINWPGELAQDKAKFFMKLNQKNYAIAVLMNGKSEVEKIVRRVRRRVHENEIDWQDDTLTREEMIGAIYVSAVMDAFLAHLTSNFSPMLESMWQVEEAYGYVPNTERLVSLSCGWIEMAFSLKGGFHPKSRFFLVLGGLAGLADAFRTDPKTAHKVLKTKVKILP